MELGPKENLLLNRIQKDFPLFSEPWKQMADELSIPEDTLLGMASSLKQKNLIRQISGIFDSHKIGYQSVLVAMEIPSENLDKAATLINSHPGVSHNYQRNHSYNLWFTLSIPSAKSLDNHISRIIQYCQPLRTMTLPAIKVYRIGVHLDLTVINNKKDKTPEKKEINISVLGEEPLSPEDIDFIRIFQKDFPIVSHPYQRLIEGTSWSEKDLLAKADEFLKKGRLRRIAGLLHHRNAGFLANAMIVWNIPDKKVEETGRLFAQNRFVSHCYQRPAYPDFPYTLYTMVHGKTQEDCQNYLAQLLKQSGSYPYQLLYSTKEFKKTRIQYYSPELEQWEKEYPLIQNEVK